MIKAYIGSMKNKDGSRTAVIVQAGKEEFRNKYILKNDCTLNLCELEGAILAMETVEPKCRKEEVEIWTKSLYVVDLTTKDKEGNWISKPKANKETVERFRNVYGTFSQIKFVHKKDDPMVKTAKELAISAC